MTSLVRRLKREAKRAAGLTFKQRLTEAVRAGTAVTTVEFEVVGDDQNRRIVAREIAR